MAEFANPTPTAARGFDYWSTVGEPRVFDAGGVVYGVALTRDGTRAAAGIGCGDDNVCKGHLWRQCRPHRQPSP